MATKAFLSKSTFIRGLQCEKSLYLHKKRPFLRDRLSEEQLAKFRRGHKVGVLARELYPGGIDVSPSSHYQMGAAIRKTAGLIADGSQVIYEASFEYEGVRVALDILYKENGVWKATEVKSSVAISDTYLWDAALQYYVISGSGVSLGDFSLAIVNESYVRNDALCPGGLFRVESCLDTVRERQISVQQLIGRLREVSLLPGSPEIAVGPQCMSPYPCDFIGHCWKREGTRPDVVRLVLDDNVVGGIRSLAAKPLAYYSSLYHRPAIPPYSGCSPYQKLAWSFAVHCPAQADEGRFTLAATPGKAFSAAQIGDLLDRLKTCKRLVVFDRETELAVILQACGDHAGLREEASRVLEDVIDLRPVFVPEIQPVSENLLPGNAVEVLRALGAGLSEAGSKFRSSIEASGFFEEMAVSPAAEHEAGLKEIQAYHLDYLRNLERLFRYATHV